MIKTACGRLAHATLLFAHSKQGLIAKSELTRVVSSRGKKQRKEKKKGGRLCVTTIVAHPTCPGFFQGALCVRASCVRHVFLITPHSTPEADARQMRARPSRKAPRAAASSVNLISGTACVYIQHHSLFRQMCMFTHQMPGLVLT